MKIRIFIMAVLSVLLSSVAGAQNDSALFERFSKDLQEKSVGIETISCSFVQTRSVAVLASDVVKEGTFYYQRPERMLLSFDDGDFIRMTENVFQTKRAGKVSRLKVASNPFMKELSRLLGACMTGDLASVLIGFDYEVDYQQGEYVLMLTPRKGRASMKVQSMMLVFDEKDMSLKALQMTEASGDYSRYDFDNKVFNRELKPELFEL